jgi:hypothetical protein
MKSIFALTSLAFGLGSIAFAGPVLPCATDTLSDYIANSADQRKEYMGICVYFRGKRRAILECERSVSGNLQHRYSNMIVPIPNPIRTMRKICFMAFSVVRTTPLYEQ